MINRPPNVFLSSTFFDLSELRAQLRHFIDELGWRPVMSEHNSFPVDPDESTVENCRLNVRNNADILVMIVGSRYGSIDTTTESSITNIEFLEARARGIPTYVFVKAEVLAQMQVWRDNPDADFSKVVDTPRVFEFIDSIRSNGKEWVFEFTMAEDVVIKLREQWSFLVLNSLKLREATRGRDQLFDELDGEALLLALGRDDNWPIKLFGTVLKSELNLRLELRREIDFQFASGDATYVGILKLREWAQDRLHELSSYCQTTEKIVNLRAAPALVDAQDAADAIEIAKGARRLAKAWEDIARWTLRCRSVRVDAEASRLIELLSLANQNVLDEIWDFGHSIIPKVEQAEKIASSGGTPELDFFLELTDDVGELNAEINRLEEVVLG